MISINNIERTVLCSFIHNPYFIHDISEYNLVKDDFSNFYNQKIYEAILHFHSQDLPFDEIVLANYLKIKEYESILMEILSITPLGDIQYYIKLLKDNKLKIYIEKLSSKLINNSKDSTGMELLAILQNSLMELDDKSIYDDFLKLRSINEIKEKKVEVIGKSYIPFPQGTVSLIVAPGDTGKTFVSINIALHFTLENIKNKSNKKIFAWLSEDAEGIIKDRYNAILSTLFSEKDQLLIKDREDLYQITDEMSFEVLNQKNREFHTNEYFYILKQKLKDFSLIILDPLLGFYTGDENDNSYARRFMQLFMHWAKKENKTIIFIHHSPKKSKDSRGASAIRDASRVLYQVDKIRDKEGKILENSNKLNFYLEKDNYQVSKYLDNKNFTREVFPKSLKIKKNETTTLY